MTGNASTMAVCPPTRTRVVRHLRAAAAPGGGKRVYRAMRIGRLMMTALACAECGETAAIPRHCGKPMHLESIDGKDRLVCWMGAGCGSQDMPTHCGRPMRPR